MHTSVRPVQRLELRSDTDPELFDVGDLDPAVLAAIEADSFWCLSKLLDGIQDNYINQQPGIQRLVKRMSELVKRIDAPLAAHFEDQGVEFMQFAFRWMNCLLMREISMKCTVRMWDTYLVRSPLRRFPLTVRPKEQMRFPSSTFMSVQHSWSSFPRGCVIWIFR